MVKIKLTNRHDIHAVAIYRDAKIVGHIPYNLTQHFLYGLEVPCVYPSVWT